jgi:hypothetical protein
MVGDDCEGRPTLGKQLDQTQIQELQELTNQDGQQQQSTASTLLMHGLSGFLPEAWEEQVKQEIRSLLDVGIIEQWHFTLATCYMQVTSLAIC